MKAYEIYEGIQTAGQRRIEQISNELLLKIARKYGYLEFPPGLNAITRIYSLIENGYEPLIREYLEEAGYDYKTELQYLLIILGQTSRMGQDENIYPRLKIFPSLLDIAKRGRHYLLNTVVGKIDIIALTSWPYNDDVKEYALRKRHYSFCHEACYQFIQEHPHFEAVTSLVNNQFGEKQYHSYIRSGYDIFDFSANIGIAEAEFKKFMDPIELNGVHGVDLKREEQTLTEEDLGEEKTMLLRLALSKQRKQI